MSLKDYYLVGDYEMMEDNLERLRKAFMQALDCASKAEFSSRESILQSVNESMMMLQALHAKKQQRDKFEVSGEGRRYWF